jgi:hypothetical protein
MEGLKLKYFVLKPAGTTLHAYACREAMRVYANVIEQENPVFAKEIMEWVDHEELKNQYEENVGN